MSAIAGTTGNNIADDDGSNPQSPYNDDMDCDVCNGSGCKHCDHTGKISKAEWIEEKRLEQKEYGED